MRLVPRSKWWPQTPWWISSRERAWPAPREEVGEQVELGRREIERDPVAAGVARGGVEAERPVGLGAVGGLNGRAAQERV